MVMGLYFKESVGSRASLKGSLKSRKPPSRSGAASAGKAVLLVSLAIVVSSFVYTISTASLKRNGASPPAHKPMPEVRRRGGDEDSLTSSSSSVVDRLSKVNCNPFDHEAVACCGHRGAPMVFPGNTVASFLEAFKQGATCVEMDVMLTRDSLLAVGHSRILNELLVRNSRQYGAGQRNSTSMMRTRSRSENMSLSDLKKINLRPLRPESDCPTCNVRVVDS